MRESDGAECCPLVMRKILCDHTLDLADNCTTMKTTIVIRTITSTIRENRLTLDSIVVVSSNNSSANCMASVLLPSVMTVTRPSSPITSVTISVLALVTVLFSGSTLFPIDSEECDAGKKPPSEFT